MTEYEILSPADKEAYWDALADAPEAYNRFEVFPQNDADAIEDMEGDEDGIPVFKYLQEFCERYLLEDAL